MTEPVDAHAPWHLPAPVLQRYADPAAGPLTAAQASSVEAHLDRCATCRGRLRPLDDDLLLAVGAALQRQVLSTPQYARPRRWRTRLTAGLPLAWLLAALAVGGLAAGLDVAARASGRPSALLLLAPVLPLLGVGASWGPQTDPLHELTATTPGAGLALLLRRTMVVLLVVVTATALYGLLTGAGALLGSWLLPSLAMTALALAAGSAVGVHRAAGALGAVWVLAVVTPSFAQRRLPALLDQDAAPGWLAALAVAAAVVAWQRTSYRHAAPVR